jgi:hypothetical protein
MTVSKELTRYKLDLVGVQVRWEGGEICYAVYHRENLPRGYCVRVEVEVNLRLTVNRPVYLGARIPSRSHDQISFISLTIARFLIWGTLSDDRTGL